MTNRTTIDRAGRVVIPKSLRDALRLEPGDALEIESSGEEITLRQVREHVLLAKDQGIRVFRTGKPLTGMSIPDLIDQAREDRIGDLLL